MLTISNIKKSYKDKEVLKGINISVQKGEVYGLIGANGAGKTTLLNIIARVIYEDSGEISINGKPIKIANDLSGTLGYIIDIPALFEYLTAYEYLSFILSPLKLSKENILEKSKKVLKEVGLSEVGDKQIKNFSRGMKQRMGIAAVLISNPEIILMDEPSSALDPQGRFEVIQIIQNLKKQGKTIMLSTHILSDVERVCDRVGLLVHGKIVEEGKLQEVLNKYTENVFRVTCDEKHFEKVVESAKLSEYFVSATKGNRGIEIEFIQGGKKEMFKTLSKINVDIDGIVLKESTIEEIFLKASKEEENV